jgi:hypothetical protein
LAAVGGSMAGMAWPSYVSGAQVDQSIKQKVALPAGPIAA